MIRLNYVHEFESKGGISFNTGGASLTFRKPSVTMEGKVGVSIGTAGNISDNYKGGGGRGGLRINSDLSIL